MNRNENGGEGFPLYLVDGYNVVLGARFTTGTAEDSRERFLRLLDSYGRRKKIDIVVVWDGKGPDTRNMSVKSLSTGGGASADERIVRLVERSANRARITVVSDDRKHIVGAVRGLGAKTMGVGEFLERVGFSMRRGKRSGRGTATTRRFGASAPGGARGSYDARAEKRPAGGLSVEQWLDLFKARE